MSVSGLTHSAAAPSLPDERTHWLAHYEAELVSINEQTRLGKTHSFGPLRVQRPFYPEGERCAHIYLLHPPGGLVAGDHLTIRLHSHAHTHGLMTTPSAGKLYNNITDLPQHQSVVLDVDADSVLEYLPQETLVFDGAKGELSTEVNIIGNGLFIGWDIVCLGRPSSADWFEHGHIVQRLSVTRDGIPLLLERNRFDGASSGMTARASLHGHAVFATFVLTDPQDRISPLTEQQRDECNRMAASGWFAHTQKPSVSIVRYLGPCADTAKRVFTHFWQLKRPELLQKTACIPRIWNT